MLVKDLAGAAHRRVAARVGEPLDQSARAAGGGVDPQAHSAAEGERHGRVCALVRVRARVGVRIRVRVLGIGFGLGLG